MHYYYSIAPKVRFRFKDDFSWASECIPMPIRRTTKWKLLAIITNVYSSHLFCWLKMRMWIHLFCIWTMFNVSVCVVYGGILLLIIPYFTISCHLSVWPEAEAEEDNKINAPTILRAGKCSKRNQSVCFKMRNLFEESSAWFTYQMMIFLDLEIRFIRWLLIPRSFVTW